MNALQKPVHIGIDARMYSSDFTGIGRYTQELVKFLGKMRPQWKFSLFLSEKAFSECTFSERNIQKILSPEAHYSFQEQTSFLKKIAAEQFDLFHFPHFNAPIFFRGKSVVTIHDLTISLYPGKKKTSWFHKIAYKTVLSRIIKKSKRIIAVSHNTKKDVQRMFHVPEEKIKVIWNGLGNEFLRSHQEEKSLHKLREVFFKKHNISKPYFLYTGVHREHKNVLGMIRAFEKFLETNPDAELVITGKEDPYYPEVRGEIVQKNLQNSVKLVGLVSEEELKMLMYFAKVFVFPSFYEGFGLPPLEAMAMEIPVIASNCSAIPEVCGNAAEYFDPHNITEMSECMIRAFHDETLRKNLVEHGNIRIQLFSWKKMAEETVKVYEEILSNPSHPPLIRRGVLSSR